MRPLFFAISHYADLLNVRATLALTWPLCPAVPGLCIWSSVHSTNHIYTLSTRTLSNGVWVWTGSVIPTGF